MRSLASAVLWVGTRRWSALRNASKIDRRHHPGGLICVFFAGASTLFAAASVTVGAGLRQEPIIALPTTSYVDPKRAGVGERLFNDVRVSGSSTYACATCHPLDRGGMDGHAVATRSEGGPIRNTPTVFNASLNASLNWDGAVNTLETLRSVRELVTVLTAAGAAR